MFSQACVCSQRIRGVPCSGLLYPFLHCPPLPWARVGHTSLPSVSSLARSGVPLPSSPYPLLTGTDQLRCTPSSPPCSSLHPSLSLATLPFSSYPGHGKDGCAVVRHGCYASCLHAEGLSCCIEVSYLWYEFKQVNWMSLMKIPIPRGISEMNNRK